MTASSAVSPPERRLMGDVGSLGVCTLIWGTTWFAITLQFGSVPPLVSVAYRFALAAALLFGWRILRRQPLGLTRAQHVAVFWQGLLTFAIDYPLIYLAEQRVVSGAVAVFFGSLALMNLVVFRILLKQSAPLVAWLGAATGLLGVVFLSADEILRAPVQNQAWIGLAFALGAVVTAAIGNIFAHKAGEEGADVVISTAWAMAYGAGALALYVTLTGQPWRFEMTTAYVGSLLYLALFGSVTAFMVYYGLARRRGYSFASYVSALMPPVALLTSTLFEHARWGLAAFAGLALVLLGQVLMIKANRA